MSVESDRVASLAGRVTDGAAIDWDAAERASETDDEREAVRGLRLLATIAEAQESPRGDLAPGSLWGPLEIGESIAHGGFSTVWRARDPRLEREVALKLLDASDPGGRDHLAEGRMMARVRHPNVVAVYGAEEHAGRVGIWMELVRGESLADRVRDRGPLGPKEAAIIGVELCRALAAVHGASVVHGDVKAQNVLREEGGRIVLADFGAGRFRLADSVQDTISGTPLYLAPEILAGGAPSVSGDLYATGVLLYHLVTGAFPVAATTLAELSEKHRLMRSTPLRDLRPDLPESFVRVVQRATSPEPERRYASAGAMEQALLESVVEASGRTKARRAFALAAVVLAGVAGSIAWWLLGSSPALDATVTLLRVRADGARETLASGSAVAPGDRLELEIESDRTAWVYVLNSDERGRAFVLFPLPGLDLQNPVPGERRHRLPGTGAGRRRYWGVDTAGGREHFLVLTSVARSEAFEAAVASLPRPASGTAPLEFDASSVDALSRGVGALLPGPPAEHGAEVSSLFELARAMERDDTLRTHIRVHEFTVANPDPDARR